MISSIISRGQGLSGGNQSGKSTSQIELGVFQMALRNTIDLYSTRYSDCSAAWKSFLDKSLTRAAPTLLNETRDADYPLDRFAIGNALLYQYNESADQTVLEAVQALQQSLDLQIRNDFGGYWYYTPYPDASYLDGIYSVLPFAAHLLLSDIPLTNSTTTLLDDLWLQVSLLYSHCFEASSSLLVHGYSASRSAVWANPQSGASPHVWGRALGWYIIGLLETLELLSSSPTLRAAPQYAKILGVYISLCEGVAKATDDATGAWWQVVTFPRRAGNYLESSATCQFTFALLKGLRLGYLEDTEQVNYTATALKAYRYTTDTFVIHSANGTLGFDKTVGSCGLNSSASYEYYVNQPLMPNSLIGTASFVLASLEKEMLDARKWQCPVSGKV